MNRRLQRLNGLLRQELSDLLLRQVKDPRLAEFVTITRVDTSPGLKTAKVFVSVMGNEDEKASTLQGLTAASSYLRKELTGRITIRRMPHLTFILDESIEEGAHILEIMNRLADQTPSQ